MPDDWPVEGRVQFDHYSTRYRPGLDLVLKDISCDIHGGQKVSISLSLSHCFFVGWYSGSYWSREIIINCCIVSYH